MLMSWNPIVAVASVVGGFFNKREESKQLERSINGKIAIQKNDNQTQVVFNEQEIDVISKRNEGNTWKDEYLTIVMTSPLITTYVGVLIGVLLARPDIIDAVTQANKAFSELVPNYQELLTLTIVAGLGLRAIKRN